MILIGHSNGGDAAIKTAGQLAERGWLNERWRHNVDLLFVFDPVRKPWGNHSPWMRVVVPSNVRAAVDLYQRTDNRVIRTGPLIGDVFLQGYLTTGTNILWTPPYADPNGPPAGRDMPHTEILDDFGNQARLRDAVENTPTEGDPCP